MMHIELSARVQSSDSVLRMRVDFGSSARQYSGGGPRFVQDGGGRALIGSLGRVGTPPVPVRLRMLNSTEHIRTK